MAKGTIKKLELLLIFLVTTLDSPSKIWHSLHPDDAGFLKLYCTVKNTFEKNKRQKGEVYLFLSYYFQPLLKYLTSKKKTVSLNSVELLAYLEKSNPKVIEE